MQKVLRIMKLTVSLLLLSVVSVFAGKSYSQTQVLNLDMKNSTVKEVLRNIEKQSEFVFMYSEKLINVNREVSANVKNKKINEVLDDLFAGTDVSYKIKDRFVLLTTPEISGSELMAQQQKSVSGKVTDSSGLPLLGVTVRVKGATQGTITNADGNYLLSNISEDATLVFSFVGMKTQEVVVGNQTSINVSLQDETIGLDELVVIGYGTVAKKDLTGAVASVSQKQFKDQPVKNVSDILQGRTPGVEVTSLSGMPGAGAKVRIRGTTSINKSNSPLYIVDGIVGGSVNPMDIQSIDVLKDASSTAIYGSRGANGVVLITTRKGAVGKNQIVFDMQTGVSKLAKAYEVMDAYEYAQALNDIRGKGTISDADLQAYKNGTKGVDYYDLMFQTGMSQDYKLSLSGGTQRLQYLVSGQVLNQDAVTITTNYKEYKLRSNLDAQVTKWLDFSLKLNAYRTHSHNGGMDMNQTLTFSPTMELKDPVTGVYNKDPYNTVGGNPYGARVSNYNDSYSNFMQANGNFLFKIIDGLTLSVQGGYNLSNSNSYWYSSRLSYPGTTDNMGVGFSESRFWQNTNNLSYAKKFGEHSLTATAVWEISQNEGTGISGDGTNLSNGDIVGYWNIQNAAARNVSNSYWGESMTSGLGRVMYNYGGRYFLTIAYRADGSSKFQGDNKWGYFPSGAIAWDLAQEGFMKDQDLFQQLKLRASYGITGNQGIGSYETLGMLEQLQYGWGTGTNYTGYWSNSYSSAHLRWEKTYQSNIGLDVSMLNNKVNLTVEYFNKQSKDLLFQKQLPGFMGGGPSNAGHGGHVWVNQGQIDNRGVEFAVTVYPLNDLSPIQWETSFNASYVKNKIVDMAGLDDVKTAYRSDLGGYMQIMKVGYPYGSFFLYPMRGFDSNGAYLYEKADGSLTIAPTGDDQRIMGQCSPAWTFGWNNSVRYKNWTLNLFFNAATGFQRLNSIRFMLSSMTGPYRFFRLKEAYEKGWDKVSDKSKAEYPNYKNGDVRYHVNGDKWLENASFLKLRNISLSYDIPKDWVKFADIQLSVSGQNVLTLTKYTGMDPEVYDAYDGVDQGAYPLPRTFTFGAKFTF